MSLKNNATKIAATIGVLVGAGLLFPAAAHADGGAEPLQPRLPGALTPAIPAIKAAEVNKVTVYEHRDYFGGAVSVGSEVTDYRSIELPTLDGSPAANGNDTVSSIANLTSSKVCFYADIDYGGGVVVEVEANTWKDWVGDSANDRISSHKPC